MPAQLYRWCVPLLLLFSLLPTRADAALKHGSIIGLYNTTHKRFIAMTSTMENKRLRMASDGTGQTNGILPYGLKQLQFKVVNAGRGQIALYNIAHRRFVTMTNQTMEKDKRRLVMASDNSGRTRGRLPRGWRWERFKVVNLGRGEIALYSTTHRRFVTMISRRLDGRLFLSTANKRTSATLPGGWRWERFKVVKPEKPAPMFTRAPKQLKEGQRIGVLKRYKSGMHYKWFGTAPICRASARDCTRRGGRQKGTDHYGRDRYGRRQSKCHSGIKVYCALPTWKTYRTAHTFNGKKYRYAWIGTAPVCGGKVQDCYRQWGPKAFYIASDKSGDGKRCLRGKKVLCGCSRRDCRGNPRDSSFVAVVKRAANDIRDRIQRISSTRVFIANHTGMRVRFNTRTNIPRGKWKLINRIGKKGKRSEVYFINRCRGIKNGRNYNIVTEVSLEEKKGLSKSRFYARLDMRGEKLCSKLKHGATSSPTPIRNFASVRVRGFDNTKTHFYTWKLGDGREITVLYRAYFTGNRDNIEYYLLPVIKPPKKNDGISSLTNVPRKPRKKVGRTIAENERLVAIHKKRYVGKTLQNHPTFKKLKKQYSIAATAFQRYRCETENLKVFKVKVCQGFVRGHYRLKIHLHPFNSKKAAKISIPGPVMSYVLRLIFKAKRGMDKAKQYADKIKKLKDAIVKTFEEKIKKIKAAAKKKIDKYKKKFKTTWKKKFRPKINKYKSKMYNYFNKGGKGKIGQAIKKVKNKLKTKLKELLKKARHKKGFLAKFKRKIRKLKKLSKTSRIVGGGKVFLVTFFKDELPAEALDAFITCWPYKGANKRLCLITSLGDAVSNSLFSAAMGVAGPGIDATGTAMCTAVAGTVSAAITAGTAGIGGLVVPAVAPLVTIACTLMYNLVVVVVTDEVLKKLWDKLMDGQPKKLFQGFSRIVLKPIPTSWLVCPAFCQKTLPKKLYPVGHKAGKKGSKGLLTPGSVIALYSRAHRRFVVMTNKRYKRDRRRFVVASDSSGRTRGRLPRGPKWEQFKVVDAGRGEIALYSIAHRRFVTMSNRRSNKRLVVTSDNLGNTRGKLPAGWKWERFKVVKVSRDEIALYNVAHRRFLTMTNRRTGRRFILSTADRKTSDKLPKGWKWERFKVVKVK